MTEQKRVNLFIEYMSLALGEKCKDIATELQRRGFFFAPASTQFHGDYEGGLFDHSFAVMKHLVDLTVNNHLKWKEARSPYIVGMFHDLCKIDTYKVSALTGDWVHSNDMLFKGHGEKSVMLLAEFMQLTEEEIACIRYHMGAYEGQETWNDFGNAVEKYPNALWTHMADMLASRVDGI